MRTRLGLRGSLFRSAGVRLALGFAAVFGFSALLLVFVLWSATLGLLNGQVDAAIRADALGLAERWQDGGANALLSTIRDRLAGNIDDDAIYLVVDSQEHPVVGNLAAWPDQVQQAGPIYELPVKRHGVSSLARLHRFPLPNGYALLVGRDVAPRAALRDLLARTLGWALLLVALLSLVGAVVVRRLFARTVSHISATAAAISAGDLSRRVALTGRGDEFDRLADTINDMLDRIGRLMDGVRHVSNAIAHDLRTPITRARARLEDALDHAGTADALRSEIGRAIADLDGITAVFGALLRISEIEAGARRSAFTELDLVPLLRDMAELYSAVAEEYGLRLDVSLHGPLLLRGDRELIQQAIANLLDNALKFSSPGGDVRLTGTRVAGAVVLGVADSGPGIPQADVARASERFFRGEQARHTPGFGLGLTLVRAVAQLHGGTLSLQPGAPQPGPGDGPGPGAANPGLHAVLCLPAPADWEVDWETAGAAGSAAGRPAFAAEREHEDIPVGGLGRV